MNILNSPSIFLSNLINNAYFSSQYNILYVATPKVACTSIKWWFADLVGVKNAIEKSIFSRESDTELIIHDSFARVAPEFTGANFAGLEVAVNSSAYFKFCIVRNPYTRAFSAWQSKWLIRESLQTGLNDYGSSDFDVIESVDDIKIMFELFLQQLYDVKLPRILDVHVAPQAALLEPQLMKYDVVARVENHALLVQSLASHIGSKFRSPFIGRHSNVSLLPYSSKFVSKVSMQLIKEIYARDFEEFGYDYAVPNGKEELSKDGIDIALRAISLLRNRNRRIGELNLALSITRYNPRSLESEAKIFLSEIVDGISQVYSESRGFANTYIISNKRLTLHLFMPADLKPVARIRVDPANCPVALWLHRLSLEQACGSVLWSWDGEISTFLNPSGVLLHPSSVGLHLLCLNDDPQFELAVPKDVLASLHPNARLVLELTPSPLIDVISEVLIQNDRLITELRADLAKRGPFKSSSLLSVSDASTLHLANEIENIASLLKNTLDGRDQTISRQAIQLKKMREEVLRAEAQLDLLKDLMLGGGDDHL